MGCYMCPRHSTPQAHGHGHTSILGPKGRLPQEWLAKLHKWKPRNLAIDTPSCRICLEDYIGKFKNTRSLEKLVGPPFGYIFGVCCLAHWLA